MSVEFCRRDNACEADAGGLWLVLTLGERSYPLVGLDTCVLSALALDRPGIRRGYFLQFSAAIPCFSPYSLLELRQSPNVYEAFVELFDVVPCMLLNNDRSLFAAAWVTGRE